MELVLFRLYSFARFTASFIDQKGGATKVDTVVLLSKLHAKQHIEVKLLLDELDLTAAESKSTYEEVKKYVLEHTGSKVSHLYIAQVKQKYGIIEQENYNIINRSLRIPDNRNASLKRKRRLLRR